MPDLAFAARLRSLVAALGVLFAIQSGPALALSVMDPFNLPAAMDSGTAKVGDGIPFADGQRFKLDVYAPEARGEPAPVVFFIYGGGWTRGERSDYQFVGRALAARGFVTVIADYRHVPEVRFPEFLEDSARALKWVETNITSYGGDPSRLFLAGHSAGAYNAVMLALDPAYLREYGVGLTVRGVAAISGPYDFYPFEYGEVQEAFGYAPSPEGTQPVNLVTAQSPPMLLMTGTTDPIVRMQNTERLAERLGAQGVWVTTRFYDGFGHMEPVIAMGSLWRWRMPVLDDVVAFFNQFGAFPSGVPYVAVTPDPPEEQIEPMDKIISDLDALFGPLAQ
jgi:acetyl esterase/lipase